MSKSIAGGIGAAAAVLGHDSADAATSKSPSEDSLPKRRPKVLFLDVNETLLDLGPLKKSVGAVLGGKEELLSLWFTTMLQYSLVNTVADRYEHFTVIGSAALQMVASNHGITISLDKAAKAIKPILSLSPHPDVEPAMEALNNACLLYTSPSPRD